VHEDHGVGQLLGFETKTVAGVTRVANVMVVNPSFPAKTVPEFIAYAKANPDRISMASGGTGSSNQMSGELFKMLAGVNLVHVPYRGAGPALPDLISGQVQVMFVAIPPPLENIRQGRWPALGGPPPAGLVPRRRDLRRDGAA